MTDQQASCDVAWRGILKSRKRAGRRTSQSAAASRPRLQTDAARLTSSPESYPATGRGRVAMRPHRMVGMRPGVRARFRSPGGIHDQRHGPHRQPESRRHARRLLQGGRHRCSQDAGHRDGTYLRGAPQTAARSPADIQRAAGRPAGDDRLASRPWSHRRGVGEYRGVLEGPVRGTRRRRHPGPPASRRPSQADPRQENGRQRQPVAGAHLPVRPRCAEPCPAAALPAPASTGPLPPDVGRRG